MSKKAQNDATGQLSLHVFVLFLGLTLAPPGASSAEGIHPWGVRLHQGAFAWGVHPWEGALVNRVHCTRSATRPHGAVTCFPVLTPQENKHTFEAKWESGTMRVKVKMKSLFSEPHERPVPERMGPGHARVYNFEPVIWLKDENDELFWKELLEWSCPAIQQWTQTHGNKRKHSKLLLNRSCRGIPGSNFFFGSEPWFRTWFQENWGEIFCSSMKKNKKTTGPPELRTIRVNSTTFSVSTTQNACRPTIRKKNQQHNLLESDA